MNHKSLLVAMAAPWLCLPGIAQADEPAPATAKAAVPTWDLSAELGAYSDYRFRGLSLSGKDPEATAMISVAHKSGFYASAWASNVDLGGGKADDGEIDWTAGFAHGVGRVTLDMGTIYYSYPGNGSSNYIEFYGSLGTTVGPVDMKVGVAYAPTQSHIGDVDNTYAYIAGNLPLGSSRFSLHGNFGYENGAFGTQKKDWLLGASADLGSGFIATVDYIDTAHSLTPMGNATAVASLRKKF